MVPVDDSFELTKRRERWAERVMKAVEGASFAADASNALWAEGQAWMASGDLEAQQLRGRALADLIDPFRSSDLKPVETVWLDRMLACHPSFPTIRLRLGASHRFCPPVLFLTHLLSQHFYSGGLHAERLASMADAVARTFPFESLCQEVSRSFLEAVAKAKDPVADLSSGWVTQALARGWLNAASVRCLLEKRVSAIGKRKVPLGRAIANEWVGSNPRARLAMGRLLASGWGVNAPFASTKFQQTTLLHVAIEAGQPELVAHLLSLGADPLQPVHRIGRTGKAIEPGQDAFGWWSVCRSEAELRSDTSVVRGLDRIETLLQACRSVQTVNDLLNELGVDPSPKEVSPC